MAENKKLSEMSFKEQFISCINKFKESGLQLNDKSLSEHEISEAHPIKIDRQKLHDIGSVISHQAVALAIAFSEPPKPDRSTSAALLSKLDNAIGNLITLYYSVPNKAGAALKESFRKQVVEVIECVAIFLDGFIQRISKSERMKQIGCVTNACEFISQLVVKNNVEAVVRRISTERNLVIDAITEFQEYLDSNDFEDDGDSDLDREETKKCLGLLKTAETCLKKVISALKNEVDRESVGVIAESDKMLELAKDISMHTDDMVTAIYPPTRKTVVLGNAHNLAEILLQLLNSSKFPSFYSNITDSSWKKFLNVAVKHNIALVAEFCGN